MTIKEYVENPMGKGDAALGTNREMVKSILTEKYQRLVGNKKIKAYCYDGPKKSQYTIHLVIPSESERNNTYDVVFEFTAADKSLRDEKSLRNYDVRVFANSPSFAYTFAYVYKKNGLLIEYLTNKLGKQFVKIAPEVRNRYQIVSYEKYIFFGAMYITESGLLVKKTLESQLSIMNPVTNYPAKIRTLEQIMREYQVAEAKVRKQKKKESVAQKKTDNDKKREVQQVRSGIHQIGSMKKTVGHPSSGNKAHKSIRNITAKKKRG